MTSVDLARSSRPANWHLFHPLLLPDPLDPAAGILVTYDGRVLHARDYEAVRLAIANERSTSGTPCDQPSLPQLVELLRKSPEAVEDYFGEGTFEAIDVLTRTAGKERRYPLAANSVFFAVAYGRTAVAKRHRAQALRAYPLLTPYLARAGEYPEVSAPIISAIDCAEPLNPVLCKVFEAPPWAIRHLRGLALQEAHPYHYAQALVRDLKQYSADRRPRVGFEHAVMREFGREFTPETRWISAASHRTVMKLGWSVATDHWRRIAPIGDYARFVSGLAVGYAAPGAPFTERLDHATGSTTLPGLQALSDLWHETENRLRPLLDLPVGAHYQGSWPAILPAPLETGGYVVECLTTAEALRAESLHLEHCVGGYAGRCQAGKSHILGIRRDGVPVATAEIRLVEVGGRWQPQLTQLSGPGNARPAAEVRAATVAAMPKLEVTEEMVQRAKAKPIEVGSSATDLFEMALLQLGEAALERYRPCLQPRKDRPELWSYVRRRARRFMQISRRYER